MSEARDDVQAALARGNAEYEKRFGFIFIIRAAGRSAEEMLSALQARLGNPIADEVVNAAAEQREITRLRLARLVGAGDDT